MPTSQPRYDLLQTRLASLTSATTRLAKGTPEGTASLRHAAWRLRELLPILGLDAPTSGRLDARLRTAARRVAKLREIHALLALVDDLAKIERLPRQAETRIKNDLRRRLTRMGANALRKKTAGQLRKALEKLEAVRDGLLGARDSAAFARATRWAVKARVARRASLVKTEVDDAGAVYLQGRLRPVRGATRRMRFAVELLADVTGPSHAADLRLIEQMHDVLERVRDAEALIRRTRRVQGAVTPPDVKAWQELDAVVVLVEHRCRRLHARYVRDRAALVAACDRLGARAQAQIPKRKVS